MPNKCLPIWEMPKNAKNIQKQCTKNAKKWLMCWQNDIFRLSRSAPGPATRAGWENDKKMTAQNRNDKQMHNQMTKINIQRPTEFAGKILIRIVWITLSFCLHTWNPEKQKNAELACEFTMSSATWIQITSWNHQLRPLQGQLRSPVSSTGMPRFQINCNILLLVSAVSAHFTAEVDTIHQDQPTGVHHGLLKIGDP